LNLQQDTEESYDACPYCLTKIVLEEAPTVAPDEPETFEPEETEPEVEETTQVETPVETPEAPSDCAHYLGYLSEKPSSEKIPDDCMVCKDIVTCMLKKMKE
jgi:DNA-directed RNA polymerase subunit RPC12/RpoP